MYCKMFEVSAGTPAAQTVNTLLRAHTAHGGCGLLSNQKPRARLVDDTEWFVPQTVRDALQSLSTHFFNCKVSYFSLLFQMFF